jgi:hypothetical protein
VLNLASHVGGECVVRSYLCEVGDLMKANYNWNYSLGLYGNLEGIEFLLVVLYAELKINNIMQPTIVITAEIGRST